MSHGWLGPKEAERALGYLEERFGVPREALSAHRLFLRGEYVCALRAEAAECFEELRSVQAGLKLLKITGSAGFKPSSRGAQVFGRAATRNVVDLALGELADLLAGRSLSRADEKGYVLLRVQGSVVGVGVVRDGLLSSQLPRSVTENLRLAGPAGG